MHVTRPPLPAPHWRYQAGITTQLSSGFLLCRREADWAMPKGRGSNHGDGEWLKNKHWAAQRMHIQDLQPMPATPGLGDFPEWPLGHPVFAFHAWFATGINITQRSFHLFKKRFAALKKKKKKDKKEISRLGVLCVPFSQLLKINGTQSDSWCSLIYPQSQSWMVCPVSGSKHRARIRVPQSAETVVSS